MGHFSKDCSSPRRPRNNNQTSGSANSANQSNNNASTNAPAALNNNNNNNNQRTVHTACTAAVHSTYDTDNKNIVRCARHTAHEAVVHSTCDTDINDRHNNNETTIGTSKPKASNKKQHTASLSTNKTTARKAKYDRYESACSATVVHLPGSDSSTTGTQSSTNTDRNADDPGLTNTLGERLRASNIICFHMDFSESWNNNNNVHISLNEHFPDKEPSDELLQEDFEYEPPFNYTQDEQMPWIFNIFDKAVQPCIQRRMFPYDLLYLPTYQNIGK